MTTTPENTFLGLLIFILYISSPLIIAWLIEGGWRWKKHEKKSIANGKIIGTAGSKDGWGDAIYMSGNLTVYRRTIKGYIFKKKSKWVKQISRINPKIKFVIHNYTSSGKLPPHPMAMTLDELQKMLGETIILKTDYKNMSGNIAIWLMTNKKLQEKTETELVIMKKGGENEKI